MHAINQCRFRGCAASAVVAAVLLTSPNAAQPVIEPRSEPVPSQVVPGQPQARDAIGALDGRDLIVPQGRLLREGSFLNRRTAAILRAPTGEWIAVFSEVEGERRLPPIVLLPNRTLASFEASIGEGVASVVVTLSGEVLAYRQRNYLIPTYYSLVSASPERAADEPGSIPASEPDPGSPPVADDPRVVDLIKDLERLQTPGRAALETSTQNRGTETLDPSVGEEDAGQALVRDGTPLVRQRGRLVRGGAGHWYFSTDSDQGTPGGLGPTPLLPSEVLMGLERLAEQRGEGLVAELTGRQYTYRGLRMVVPTMFVVAPPGDVSPLQ